MHNLAVSNRPRKPARRRTRSGFSPDEQEIFRQNAVAFREEARLTIEQASILAGVSKDTIIKYESRTVRSPSLPELQRLAAVYGRTPGQFIDPAPGALNPDLISPRRFDLRHPYFEDDEGGGSGKERRAYQRPDSEN